MRIIRYIGNDAICKAFSKQTGITWTTGMTATVLDDKVAAEMLKHPTVFVDASNASDPVAAQAAAIAAVNERSATRRAMPRIALFPGVGSDVPSLSTSGPGGPTPISGSVFFPHTTPNVSLVGSVPIQVSALGTDYFSNNAAGVTGSGATAFAVEFEGYFDDIALVFRNAVSNQSSFWVWATDPVSGELRPTTAAPVLSSAAAPNSLHYERITFGALAQRQVKVYTFYADFGGVYVKPTQTLSPVAPYPRKMCVISDSYGAGAAGVNQPMTWPFSLARVLGVELFLNAVGSTGLVAVNAGAGGNNNFASVSRIAAAIESGATDFFIAGSINDSTHSTIDVVTAAGSIVNQISAALPSARFWMAGVSGLPVGAASTGNNLANNTALASFAAERKIPFIDTLDGWYSGTGKVGSTASNGNRDTLLAADGIHPSQDGHNYIAARKYQSILSLGW